MDSAEQVVERVSNRVEGGKEAAELLNEAVRLLIEAKEHWIYEAAAKAARRSLELDPTAVARDLLRKAMVGLGS
jgi:hypothetical protein